MPSGDGRYVISYNGEIYNYAEVRGELAREGVQFQSGSDTEVIVEGYARWGAAVLERLRGMFAFAIWDTRLGHLFLARDRLGIKPLYVVTTDEGDLCFGSEVRALLAAGATRRRLSNVGVASYLTWGSVAEPGTILQGVEEVGAGTYLSWRPDRIDMGRYWEPHLRNGSIRTFDEAREVVTPLLRRAVALRLVADVPVGVFLSGGIDSAVITALASSESQRPLHTFTVSFEEAASNEGAHAAAVAEAFGCVHHDIRLRQERVREELDHALDALDQPSSDGTNTYFVSQAVRAAGISVVLSGLGGDEVFGGYKYFRQFGLARLLAGRGQALGGLAEEMLMRTELTGLPRESAKLAALAAGGRGPTAAYTGLRCMFTARQRSALLAPDLFAATERGMQPDEVGDAAQLHGRDAVNVYSVLELNHYLRNTLLRDTDTMSMAHALEVRVPLLDHVLVETLLSIPGRLKLSRRVNKPLLLAASPPVPERVFARNKMGFSLPWNAWLRGALRPRMEELLGDASISALGFFRPGAVQRLWKAFLAGDQRVTTSRVWTIAVLSAWCQRHRITI